MINRIVLKEKRDAKKMSIRDLSRFSGINIATISKIECGKMKNPTIETLVRICKVLDLEINDVIDTSTINMSNWTQKGK